MSQLIDKEVTLKIVKKLKAKIDKKRRNHDRALVYHDEKLIADFGIRRGRKGLSHRHVPDELSCKVAFALKLATCKKTKEDWLKIAKESDQVS